MIYQTDNVKSLVTIINIIITIFTKADYYCVVQHLILSINDRHKDIIIRKPSDCKTAVFHYSQLIVWQTKCTLTMCISCVALVFTGPHVYS